MYAHYGLEQRSATGRRDDDADRAITRSEEELHVGKEQPEAGTAPLRKWVETEPVEMDVQLRKETARVVRESIDEPVEGGAIGEDDVEVKLREEPGGGIFGASGTVIGSPLLTQRRRRSRRSRG